MGEAGVGSRFVADLLDWIIMIIPISIVLYYMTGKFSFDWVDSYQWTIIYTIYLTIVPVIWKGYIIGKRICHIQIKSINHGQVDLYHMFLREVIGKFLLSYITFGVATIVSIFMVIFRKDKRAIHDFIGGTYVAHVDSTNL
ncbi:RDD family protein [Heyndrickxia sporothermodurans]